MIMAIVFFVVAIWNVKWELVEKGYYLMCFMWGVFSAFVLSKVIRDNQEDKEDGLLDLYANPKTKKED